jgi:hypothetical protein
METIFVLTHLIMVICIGIICVSIASKKIAEEDLKKAVSPISNPKPMQSTIGVFYGRVTGYLAAFQNSILLIFNINNPKT